MTILLLTRVLDPPELQYLLIKNELQAPEKQGSVLSRYPESYPVPDMLQRAEVLTRAGRFRGEFWRGSETGDPNFAGMSTDAEPRLLPKDSEGAHCQCRGSWPGARKTSCQCRDPDPRWGCSPTVSQALCRLGRDSNFSHLIAPGLRTPPLTITALDLDGETGKQAGLKRRIH